MRHQSAVLSFRAILAAFCSIVTLNVALDAQAPQAPAANPLPLRRVVLYKSGVAHFEHLGRVRGNQDVTISFTTGQLDDVLKSLTAIDMGGGQITGIHYNSQEQIDRRLGALRLSVGEKPTRAQFLSAMRGARLEVVSGTRRTAGRLLSVETTSRKIDGVVMNVETLALVGDAGDIHTVALDPGVTVKLLDNDLSHEIGRYLAVVGSARDADVRRLTIATNGAGERDLFVSYVSEAPVWKSTYRLVLPTDSARPALLQGWAIVDNTGGEDWSNVEMSLVAGAPQSFVQAISKPFYVKRPVVTLRSALTAAPHTHQRALNLLSTNDGLFSLVVPRLDAVEEVTMKSEAGVNITIDGALPRSTFTTTLRQQAVSADAANLGELFEYRIKQPVTINKGQSALVPILAADIKAERVSVWNAKENPGRPLRAIWITNDSGLTLDGGNFSVIDADKFAGEGLIDPLRPGERRVISFAVDLGLVVDAGDEEQNERISNVSIHRGLIRRTVDERRRVRYTVRNEDSQKKTLVLEHPAEEGWKLTGASTPTETTAGWHRFRVEIAPRSTATLDLEEKKPVSTDVLIATLTDDHLALFVKERTISPEVETALRDIQRRKAEVARVASDIKNRTIEIEQIHADQARVRENMRALKGTSEERQLLQRYVRQLDEQETRIRAIDDEVRRLTAELATAKGALAQAIEGLSASRP